MKYNISYLGEAIWKHFPIEYYRMIVPRKPRMLQIEHTTRCNLACQMCTRFGMKDFIPNCDMEPCLFKKIIDDASPELEILWLGGIGEPLLHPNIVDMVQYVKSKDIKVIMVTNGMILEDYAEEIVSSGLDELIISIDGATEATMKHVRGADFNRIKAGIEAINRYKTKYKKKVPQLSSNFVLRRDNYKEARIALVDAIQRYDMQNVKFQNIIPWNDTTTKLSLLSDRKAQFELKYMTEFLSTPDLPKFELEGQEAKCRMPFFGPPNVRVDGKLVACTFDTYSFDMNYIARDGEVVQEKETFEPLVMGDMNAQGIEEVWKNEKYRDLRESFVSGKPMSPCDICLSQYRVVC